jgi:hypothetical protein
MSKVTGMIMKLFLPEVSAGACFGGVGCCCGGGKRRRAYTCLGTCVRAESCKRGCGV